jgi:ATPase subunit of ABC transporter with duplicated ATPase domains
MVLRLHLAAVLICRPNVLILDEPSNDMDLSTLEVGALQALFNGISLWHQLVVLAGMVMMVI